MKIVYILLIASLVACNANEQNQQAEADKTEPVTEDSVPAKEEPVEKDPVQKDPETDKPKEKPKENKPDDTPPPSKIYSNERFRNVTVQKKGDHRYLVKGKAQVFEATLNWVVEDGHEVLQKGFATADAGGPEWGNFSFTVEVAKKRSNSTLHLILFEASAKDGSQQYELPIRLE